jgi:glycosyltransferase involved in cell wall biosynthesis
MKQESEMNARTDYVVITPARNEAERIEGTIQAVASQTIRPREWVVVDDGSTDGTGEILDSCAARYPWIRVLHRSDRGFRKPGGGVIEAFNEGLAALQSREWEFIVKLDGDLTFEPNYFQECLNRFFENPRLGVAGGGVYHKTEAGLDLEGGPKFHVRGATKIYRRACWEALGGLIQAPGWDTLDEVKANMLGWETQSFPELILVHHKPTGSADGTWGNWVKNGRANYISGYHPLFMFIKCLGRLTQKPYLAVAVALFWGFISGYWKQIPQIEDKALIRYLRQQQIRRLLGRPSIWK